MKFLSKIVLKHNAFFLFFIELKIKDEIITNVDIDNEYRYLIALSPDLQNVDKKNVIAVTGTNGKSTTVSMIGQMIRQNTKKVKVIKDTESCPKLILNGIHVTSSVKGLIENSGGKIEI